MSLFFCRILLDNLQSIIDISLYLLVLINSLRIEASKALGMVNANSLGIFKVVGFESQYCSQSGFIALVTAQAVLRFFICCH